MQRGDVYKCNRDGTVIEVLAAKADGGPLASGGEEMRHLQVRSEDAGQEKHVPVVEPLPDGVKVKVGAIPHPMEPDHYIEWIELRTADRVYRKYLKPGDAPEAVFPALDEEFVVLEYCNLHGLWKASN